MRTGLGGNQQFRLVATQPSAPPPGWRLPGLRRQPSNRGMVVALAVALPLWALIALFGYNLSFGLGQLGPDEPVVESGHAAVESCERTWFLGMQHRCMAVVAWDGGTSWTRAEILATRPLVDGARVSRYAAPGAQSAAEVYPADFPQAPPWTSYLVMLAFFLPGAAVGARCGWWVGNLLFPLRRTPVGKRDSTSVAPGISEHPDNPYQVQLSPGRLTTPSLIPSGHGAVLVRTRFRKWRASRHDVPEPPVVGLDGRAALFGWGTALVAVPAGRHVVQVQFASKPDAERMVDVPVGEIVGLAYAASGSPRKGGVIGPPRVSYPGVPRVLPIVFAVWTVAQWAAHWVGVSPAAAWVLFVAGPAFYFGWIAAKVGLDRWTRGRASGGSASAFRDSVPRLIGAAEPPAAAGRQAAVVVGFTFRRKCWDGAGPPEWVAAPVLRIDGREVPASWSTWWYPVAPGPHQVEVVAPAATAIRVDASAGTAGRLSYEADLREPDARATAALEVCGVELGPDSPRVPRIRKHPDSPYEVWSPHQGDPEPPPGYGAIAIRTWFGTWLPKRRLNFRLAQRPTVGVDGQPALLGWGTAWVLVPAGRRLVHVQTVRPEAERTVDVPAGGVVELEFAASRHLGWSRGVLGPPGQRQPGAPLFTTAVGLVAGYAVVADVAARWGMSEETIQSVVVSWSLLLMVVSLVCMGLVKRQLDRRARIRAQGPVSLATHFGGRRDAPILVGAAQPPDPPAGWGAVILTSSFYRDVFEINGELFRIEEDPRAWTPPPLVRIDGREVSAGWSSWWLPLAPGSRTIEVVRPSPASLRVDVVASRTQYLHYHVDMRIMGGGLAVGAAGVREGGEVSRFAATPPTKARTVATGVVGVGSRVKATLVRDSERRGRAKATRAAHLHASASARREWMLMFHFSRRHVE